MSESRGIGSGPAGLTQAGARPAGAGGAAPTIVFNGTSMPMPDPPTLCALLDAQGLGAARIATAVNGEFVPRTGRASKRLEDGDKVLTFEAIVGG